MILTDNNLQFTSIPVILSAYLTYCKGGYNVSYGRLLNSRGGSTKAQATSRHGGAALEREEAARVQSSRFMAYQSERATGMDGKAEQQREVTTLAISASSTDLSLLSAKPESDRPCVMLPVCNYHTPQQERQVHCGVIFIDSR